MSLAKWFCCRRCAVWFVNLLHKSSFSLTFGIHKLETASACPAVLFHLLVLSNGKNAPTVPHTTQWYQRWLYWKPDPRYQNPPCAAWNGSEAQQTKLQKQKYRWKEMSDFIANGQFICVFFFNQTKKLLGLWRIFAGGEALFFCERIRNKSVIENGFTESYCWTNVFVKDLTTIKLQSLGWFLRTFVPSRKDTWKAELFEIAWHISEIWGTEGQNLIGNHRNVGEMNIVMNNDCQKQKLGSASPDRDSATLNENNCDKAINVIQASVPSQFHWKQIIYCCHNIYICRFLFCCCCFRTEKPLFRSTKHLQEMKNCDKCTCTCECARYMCARETSRMIFLSDMYESKILQSFRWATQSRTEKICWHGWNQNKSPSGNSTECVSVSNE